MWNNSSLAKVHKTTDKSPFPFLQTSYSQEHLEIFNVLTHHNNNLRWWLIGVPTEAGKKGQSNLTCREKESKVQLLDFFLEPKCTNSHL